MPAFVLSELFDMGGCTLDETIQAGFLLVDGKGHIPEGLLAFLHCLEETGRRFL